MNLTDAVSALVYLCENSSPFSGDHALYSTVEFVRGYPLGSMDTPTVAFSTAGGSNSPKGLGDYDRRRRPRVQVDVLADDAMAAARVLQNVRAAILADYNHDGDSEEIEDGEPSRGYLLAQGVKSVTIGEANDAVWDEAGRVKRLVADAVVEFFD